MYLIILITGLIMSLAIFELYINNAIGNAIIPDKKVAIVILKNEYLIAINNCPLFIISIKFVNTTFGSGTNNGLTFFAHKSHTKITLSNNSNLFTIFLILIYPLFLVIMF